MICRNTCINIYCNSLHQKGDVILFILVQTRHEFFKSNYPGIRSLLWTYIQIVKDRIRSTPNHYYDILYNSHRPPILILHYTFQPFCWPSPGILHCNEYIHICHMYGFHLSGIRTHRFKDQQNTKFNCFLYWLIDFDIRGQIGSTLVSVCTTP